MESNAFDSIASSYDSLFTVTEIGYLQRLQVYKYLEYFLKGSQVQNILDIGCGTGADAAWFANQGKNVYAIDQSKEMIQTCLSKYGNQQNIKFIHADMLQMTEVLENKRFDLIFSNFGAVNCIDPHLIKKFSDSLLSFLNAGGNILLIVMTDFCAWESVYYFIKGNFSKWSGRKKMQSVSLQSGHVIDTWFYNPQSLLHLMGHSFHKVSYYPIGLFVPPSYFEKNKYVMRLLPFLSKLDSMLFSIKRAAFYSDHFLIHLQIK